MWAGIRSGWRDVDDVWWAGRESNPHSRRRLVYSQLSSPPAQPTHCESGTGPRAAAPWWIRPPDDRCTGADDGTRTRNLRFTKPLLYQLSYVGATGRTLPQNDPFRRRGMIWPGGWMGQAWPVSSRSAARSSTRQQVVVRVLGGIAAPSSDGAAGAWPSVAFALRWSASGSPSVPRLRRLRLCRFVRSRWCGRRASTSASRRGAGDCFRLGGRRRRGRRPHARRASFVGWRLRRRLTVARRDVRHRRGVEPRVGRDGPRGP